MLRWSRSKQRDRAELGPAVVPVCVCPTMVRPPLGALKGSGSTRRCLKRRNAPDWRAVRPPSGRCRGPTRAGTSGNADSNSPRKLLPGKLVFAGDSGAGGDSGAFLRARRQTPQLVIFLTQLALLLSVPLLTLPAPAANTSSPCYLTLGISAGWGFYSLSDCAAYYYTTSA